MTTHVLLGGGIGSGKSTVATLFVDSGFVLVEADRIGHEVLRPGTDATHSIEQIWPETVLDGVVDRGALAAIVFGDPTELHRLEAITHPAIADEIQRRIDLTGDPIVLEMPVQHLDVHGEWCRVAVIADSGTRLARAVARGNEAGDVRRRMAAQPTDDAWIAWADVVIDNSGAWAQTEQTVRAVIAEIVS